MWTSIILGYNCLLFTTKSLNTSFEQTKPKSRCLVIRSGTTYSKEQTQHISTNMSIQFSYSILFIYHQTTTAVASRCFILYGKDPTIMERKLTIRHPRMSKHLETAGKKNPFIRKQLPAESDLGRSSHVP